MRKRKYIISAAMASILMLGATSPVLAQSDGLLISTEQPVQEIASLQDTFNLVNGKITEVKDDYIIIENIETEEVLRLTLSDETYIVNNDKKEKAKKSELKKGKEVYAYVSPAMTRSIPAQTSAYVILTECDRNGLDVPNYFRVGKVLESDEESVAVMNMEGNLIMKIDDDSNPTYYEDGEKFELSEMKEGMHILAYYEFVMLSYPGQTNADDIIVLPKFEEIQKKDGWIFEDDSWFFYKDGEMSVSEWVAGKDAWYYVGKDGRMLTSDWIAKDSSGSVWYYLDANGKMVSDTIVNGYCIDKNGEWRKAGEMNEKVSTGSDVGGSSNSFELSLG